MSLTIDEIMTYRLDPYHDSLDLGYCPENWKEALSTNDFSQLKILKLNCCELGTAGMSALAFMKWKKLQQLQLQDNELGEGQIIKLLSFDTLSNLLILDLNFNCLGKGAKQLVKIEMKKLRQLRLENCQLSNELVKHLCKGYWRNLKILKMSNNHIEYDGFVALWNNNWQQVRYIDLVYNYESIIASIHMMAHKKWKTTINLEEACHEDLLLIIKQTSNLIHISHYNH